MGDFKVIVVFCDLCNLSFRGLRRTLYVDRFVKRIFPHEQKIVLYHSKRVPNLAINNMPEERRDMAQDVTTIEEDAARLLRVRSKQKYRKRWNGLF